MNLKIKMSLERRIFPPWYRNEVIDGNHLITKGPKLKQFIDMGITFPELRLLVSCISINFGNTWR